MRIFVDRPITLGWLIAELVILNAVLVIIVPLAILSMLLASGDVRVIVEIGIIAAAMILLDYSLQSRAIARRLTTVGDSASKGWLVPWLGVVLWPASLLVLVLYVISIERGRKAVA
jgi:hypothetical protein